MDMSIYFFLRLAQSSSIGKSDSMNIVQRKQNTVTRDKKETELIARGRHDPCVVPRGMLSNIQPPSNF